jgi:hypothetical protein
MEGPPRSHPDGRSARTRKIARRIRRLAALLVIASAPSYSQDSLARVQSPALFPLQSEVERQYRSDVVRGLRPIDGFLLRSPTILAHVAQQPVGGWSLRSAGVDIALVHNTALPLTLNDGALWAGVGPSLRLTGGIAARRGRVRVVLAPTLTYSSNQFFHLPQGTEAAPPIPSPRSPWSSPFHWQANSIDLPRRFGAQSLGSIDLGQSSVTVMWPHLEVGASHESQWWGPGARNALLLSNAGPGFGHLFVRTAHPLRTAIGAIEARYVLGMLTGSRFFETDAPHTEPARSLSSAAVTLRPAAAPALTIGISRMVLGAQRDDARILRSVLDVFRNVGRPNALPFANRTQQPGYDQLMSVFGHWLLPEAGAEAWAEWGRAEQPRSFRDFLVAPNHSQAFTLGMQVVRELRWRPEWVGAFLAEHTQTTQSSTFRERPTGSWYTSRAVIHGFTQRGQPLGAAVGPGAHTQWASFDAHSPTANLGVYVTRIRWDDDALYNISRPLGNGLCKHDVSLIGGLRAGRRTRHGWATVDVNTQQRINAYYESSGFCFFNEQRVDRQSVQLSVTFTPLAAGRRRPPARPPASP